MTVTPNPYSPFATADPALRHIIPIPRLLADCGVLPVPGALAGTGCGQLAVVPADVIEVLRGHTFPPIACPKCVEAFAADRIDDLDAELMPCIDCETPTPYPGLCVHCRQERHNAWWAKQTHAEEMPQPPAEDHTVPADGRPEPDPFDFDFEAAEKRHHLRVRDHWNDTNPPWPLHRLREYLQLSDTLPGHTDDAPRWQESNARVADIGAAFDHIALLEHQLSEARELAHLLLAAGTEIADDLSYLQEYDDDLAHENLPNWLTNVPGAPEEWQTPDRDHQAQMDAADAVEYDPDYGKDLDYDDEANDADHDYTEDGD